MLDNSLNDNNASSNDDAANDDAFANGANYVSSATIAVGSPIVSMKRDRWIDLLLIILIVVLV